MKGLRLVYRRLWVEEGVSPEGEILVRVLTLPREFLKDLQDGNRPDMPPLQRFQRVSVSSCPCFDVWTNDSEDAVNVIPILQAGINV